jgi:hypothetical protein
MRRLAWGLVPLCLVFGTGQANAYSADDTQAAIAQVAESYGVSAQRLTSIVGCETGWTFSPNVIGDRGTSFGAAQLHHGGLLEHFRSVGYTDPFSPYQAIEYLGRALIGEWVYLGIGGWSWTCR